MSEVSHYINGQWIAGQGDSFAASNPINGETIWQGQQATVDEVKQAVDSARAAFPAWSKLSAEQRLAYLKKFADIVAERKEIMAQTIAEDTGKPLWEARTEAGALVAKVMISEQAYQQRTSTVRNEIAAGTSVVRHRAHGVIAVFGPFNFPAHLPNGHIVPALLAGNTIVFKPSELTPKTAQYLLECWQQAELPAGVLNLVQGGRDTGIALAQAQIDGLFFTGSYATGKKLHEQLAGQPEKILALEMGGNNPLIVTNTSDVTAAAYLTIQSAFISAGQRCTCARRVIVPQGDAGDKFIAKLVTETKKIMVGTNRQDGEPFMGPVITEQSALALLAAQEKLQQAGGESLVTLKHLQVGTGLVSPGIIDVTHVKNLADEEFFGPLLQIIRCKDFDEAISIANNTQYGLAAGIICDDKSLYEQFFQQSHAGIVNWNQQLTGSASTAPFGGVGYSGNHRPAAFYAADFCAFPVASIENDTAKLPEKVSPGLSFKE